MGHQNGSSAGKAYGFFYCNAPKQAVETELPIVREMIGTPSQLELSLIEGMDNVRGDERLTAIAQVAKKSGINYMLQATYPNATDRDTAEELATILNQAYQSPLYRPKEPFKGAVFYEENGRYLEIESSN